MWDHLGFSQSPYDTKPLRCQKSDIPLLVGRGGAALEFCTTLESRADGITVLSGPPGVGKTSFLNIQQLLLATGDAACGPRVVPAFELVPVNANDDATAIALRTLSALCASIDTYCREFDKPRPKQLKETQKWLSSRGASGFEFGFQVLGNGINFGRTIELPAVSDAPFERLSEVIAGLAALAVTEFGVGSVVIALDNLESLELEQLGPMLMSFRDTLFDISNIWWVLIGQSGLGSLLYELDQRVADRIEGSGIELPAISFDELHAAIAKRVERFHTAAGGNAPLPAEIHRVLYESSQGEIRFVFKYANAICVRYVTSIRKEILDNPVFKKQFPDTDKRRKQLDEALGDNIARNPLNPKYAEKLLREIVAEELNALALTSKEKQVLQAIGTAGSARGQDHQKFGVNSNQSFSSNFLVPLYDKKLLARKQEGRARIYTLRGLAKIAHSFDLLR